MDQTNTLIIAAITFLTAVVSPLIAYKIAQRKTKEDFYNKTLQNRYKLLYCPLRISLIDTHISSGRTRFYFSQRVDRALPFFKKLKIRDGFKRLSKDFGSDPIYEVEYGKQFPLNEIDLIVKKNGRWADAKLLNLVQKAKRSEYEALSLPDHDSIYKQGLIESEMAELAFYIWDKYEKLNRRLMPET